MRQVFRPRRIHATAAAQISLVARGPGLNAGFARLEAGAWAGDDRGFDARRWNELRDPRHAVDLAYQLRHDTVVQLQCQFALGVLVPVNPAEAFRQHLHRVARHAKRPRFNARAGGGQVNRAHDAEALVVNDVISLIIDIAAGKAWWAKNGTVISGDPVAGTGAMATFTPGATIYLACSPAVASTQIRVRTDPAEMTEASVAGFTDGWPD
jgi:hypothetical protein